MQLDHQMFSLHYRHDVFPQDIEHVQDVIHSTRFFYAHEILIALELVEERLTKGTQSGYWFIFAEIEGNVVAYSCYGEIPCTQGSYDLYWIVTHQNYQGKGIGKQLLIETETTIRQVGGRAIYVETASREQYTSTRHFYEHCHYLKEAQLKDFYDIGDDKVIYVKRF